MKTLIIFYSFTGKTRKIATDLAEKENADIIEVKETKKRSTVGAYIFGSFAAMRQKSTEIEDLPCDFSGYDKIIIAMPIWAGFPAPAMNNIISFLPADKEIELIMTSGSGNSSSSEEKTKALIAKKGCHVVKYQDIKSYIND